MRRFWFTFSGIFAVFSTVCLGQNVTIDFESIPNPGGAGPIITGIVAAPYSEEGYSLTINDTANLSTAFTSVHAGNIYDPATGVSLAITDPSDTTILTKDDSGAFNLISIQLDTASFVSSTITFTGFYSGGGEVSYAFPTDATAGSMQTVNFATTGEDFSNLTEVRWIGTNFPQWDTIVVQAIPEPSTYALIAGLLCGGLVMFRRRAVRAEVRA